MLLVVPAEASVKVSTPATVKSTAPVILPTVMVAASAEPVTSF